MTSSSSKIIQISDSSAVADLMRSGPKQNFIVIRHPETGEILQVRKNLVVRDGREFSLRRMFNIPYPTQTLSQLNERAITTFGIGTGGTPLADPFNPIAPTPADIALNNQVAFRTATSGVPLSAQDLERYFDANTVSGTTSYYKKLITGQTLVRNDAMNEIYVRLTLEINSLDARNQLISELALYSSRITGATHVDFAIATRVTFQTEPLSEASGKGLTIEYYVYA